MCHGEWVVTVYDVQVTAKGVRVLSSSFKVCLANAIKGAYTESEESNWQKKIQVRKILLR